MVQDFQQLDGVETFQNMSDELLVMKSKNSYPGNCKRNKQIFRNPPGKNRTRGYLFYQ
jgi:hypothetical protein